MLLSITSKEKQLLLKALNNNSSCKSIIKKLTHTIKSRSAKNKGASWQKEICHLISHLIDIPYTQSDDSLIQSRTMGLNGVDVILRDEAKEKFPYSVECKNCNKITLNDWIKQASNNGENWLLFIKNKLVKKIVVMNIETFIDLWQKISNSEIPNN